MGVTVKQDSETEVPL